MRNVKILGLALVAVLAMSALASVSASADVLTSEKQPVTLTGFKDGTFVDEFTTTAGVAKCPSPTYSATLTVTSTSTATVTANYNDALCSFAGFPEATVDMKSCKFVFHVNAGTGTPGTEGTVDLECSGSDEVTITAKSIGVTKCIAHVPTQTAIPGIVTYANIGSGGTTREITVNVALTGIKYTHTKGSETLGACPSGSATNGSLRAKAIVTGEIDPLTGAGDQHIGIFLS